MKRRSDARYQQAGTQESAKMFIWLLCLVAGLRPSSSAPDSRFSITPMNSDGHLLYLLRFLNVLFLAALVWLSFLAAREFFSQREWLALCVPVLVAFIPQDMFYGIENDNLSPLLFGAVFLCLVRWWRAEVLSPLLAACLGLNGQRLRFDAAKAVRAHRAGFRTPSCSPLLLPKHLFRGHCQTRLRLQQ